MLNISNFSQITTNKMTTVVSPDQYCKNPSAYKNTPGITDTTRQYWDKYCALKKELAQGNVDPKSLRKALPQALQEFIAGIISPQGLAMLSIVYGFKITYRSVKAVVGNILKNGLDEDILKAAQTFVEAGGDEAIANGGAIFMGLGRDMYYLDIKVAEKAGYSGGNYAVARIFESLEEIGETFEIVFAIAMLLGMIFDAYDPCDLQTQLTAEALQEFNTNFNDEFRSVVLQQLETVQDSYGDVIETAVWPIEYYADASALIPFIDDKYKTMEQNYMYAYLNSLNFNSCGMPIIKVRGGTGQVINNNVIKGLELNLLSTIGDNNTVIENWLAKWWPLLLGFLILIGMTIFMVRNNIIIKK